MTKIKICGLRRPEDVEYVNCFSPDYVGFVFAESKRQITKESARELRAKLLPGIVPVGVFVNAPIEQVAELLNEGLIDIAQLHGDEDSAYISRLRSVMRRGELIKAVRVASEESLTDCGKLDVEYLLFDAFSHHHYGGTGDTFDWKLIQEIEKPFFLAGGLNGDNIQRAIGAVHPFAVDVSSGVETDGFKDRKKIADVIEKVRNEE